MLLFSNSRGYASLSALVCSVIILNFALGHFVNTRAALRVHGNDALGLLRKEFYSNSLPEFWKLSEQMVLDGITERQFSWENEKIIIRRSTHLGQAFLFEKMEVTLLNHLDWGKLQGIRIHTEARVISFKGRKE